MKVVIVGAGPAGLYAAILLKRARPDASVRVFEQNPAHATFGFGVVFSAQAMGFLREDDAQTADLIEPAMQRWSDISVVHRGERIAIDGVGFHAIGRLELLALLQRRAAELGVVPHYETRLHRVADAEDADLVIAADGLNSMVRAESPAAYGERIEELDNRFVWYGATRAFDTLTQTFKSTSHGPFNAHHYRYAPDRSTFIVECDPGTFERAGFAHMSESEGQAFCAEVFAEELDGAALVRNRSTWRRFPVLHCDRWFDGNRVLVGDALHTAHFSIGSGTRLALEDVIALVGALGDTGFDVGRALPLYQERRQPVLEKITRASRASAAWYERFGEHMALAPWPFARSYIHRAGRLGANRLRRMSPRFCDALQDRGLELTPE